MLRLESNLRVSGIKLLTEDTFAKDRVIKMAKTVPFGHLGEAFSFCFFGFSPPCISSLATSLLFS